MTRDDRGLAPDPTDVNGDAVRGSTADHSPTTNGTDEEDPRDRLDALRERIRSGDLSREGRDQLDQLVFTVALADLRADKAVRDFPGELAVQRALAAEAWARVASQLHAMLGQKARR